MNKLNKISTSINTTRGLAEMEQQVRDIKNSNLTEEEKQKALKSHNKMIKTTLVVTISACLLATILCGIICNVVKGDLKIILCLIIALVTIIGLICFALFGKKLFKDFRNAYEIVDKGFDGLSEDVVNILKPNNKEELLIKKYKKKSLISGLLFLLAIGLLFTIILALDIDIYSPITIILALIITGIWYFFEDTYSVEIHRIKSGYYKQSYGFICEKCKTKVSIKFEELERYNSLPKNKDGIRVMNCHNCGNPVPIYNYDLTLKEYKKYLDEIK